MPEEAELLKQAGQSINTLVAVYSFIDKEFREQYKNNLIIINKHWEGANSDHKNTTYTPLYEEDREGIKISSKYVTSIIENHISAAGSVEYQLFRGRIVAARNTLIKFAKQRVENTIFFKKSKKVDEISFAINFVVIELEKCAGYNGAAFHAQQSHLNIIKDFVTKFLSDKEIKIQYIPKFTTSDDDNAKTSVSTDFSEKIERALNHLKQMNQNRTSSEKFRGIAAKSCRIAEKTLHLIIGILQPMTNLISGYPSDLITLMDAKDLQHGKIATTVGGGKLELIHENIFINEIRGLAAAIVDPLSVKVIHLSAEVILSRISTTVIQQFKREYNYDTNATHIITPTSCPLVLYKKVLHKNEDSVHILADVHEFKREYKTIVLFSNKTLLPKEPNLHSIYILKTKIKKNKGNIDEVLIYYAKDDKRIQEQKVDISSDKWDSISKCLCFPENADSIVEVKESEKIGELVKQFQLDSSIEQRLYQIGMMINLSGVLLQLNRFAHLVARHASFRGDVAVYSEKSNDIIFAALNALGGKINEFYQAVEPLLNHIKLLKTCIGSKKNHVDFMNFYMDKVRVISEIVNETNETKESVHASLLSEIKTLDEFRENSTIGEDAKENERRLRELMIFLNEEYTLKLDNKSIALLGESLGIDKNLQTDQTAQIGILSNPIKYVQESNPEIKRISMNLKALIEAKENSHNEIKKHLKTKKKQGGKQSTRRRESIDRELIEKDMARQLSDFQNLSKDLELIITAGTSEQSISKMPCSLSEHSLKIKVEKEEENILLKKQSSNSQVLFYYRPSHSHTSPQENKSEKILNQLNLNINDETIFNNSKELERHIEQLNKLTDVADMHNYLLTLWKKLETSFEKLQIAGEDFHKTILRLHSNFLKKYETSIPDKTIELNIKHMIELLQLKIPIREIVKFLQIYTKSLSSSCEYSISTSNYM